MGWTYTNRYEGTIDEFFDKEYRNYDGSNSFVGKGAVINFHEYYRAMKDDDGSIYCFVALIDLKGDENYNFGYKPMTDFSGPGISNCPERILKMLTPTDHEFAKNWRECCLEKINKRKAANKLKPGTIIKFDTSFTFGDVTTDTFVFDRGYVYGYKNKISFLRYVDANGEVSKSAAMIKDWKLRNWHIVDSLVNTQN